jgi:hypothetical protein
MNWTKEIQFCRDVFNIMDHTASHCCRIAPEEEVLGASAHDARMLRTLLASLDGMVFRCRNDAGLERWTLSVTAARDSPATGR